MKLNLRQHFPRRRTVVIAAIATTLLGVFVLLRPRIVINSPASRAALAIHLAESADTEGNRSAATRLYKEAIDSYHEQVDVSEQVARYLMLHASFLGSPCDSSHTQAASWLITGFDLLPAKEQTAHARRIVVDELMRCAMSMDVTHEAEAFASISLLDRAAGITNRPLVRESASARANVLRRDLAHRVEAERPYAALRLYVSTPGDEAMDRARTVMDGMGDAPWLWAESSVALGQWIERAEQSGRGELARRVRRTLDAALDSMESERAAAEEADEERLAELLRASPTEPIALALAARRRRNGDCPGALAALDQVLPLGRTTAETQVLYGECLFDIGKAEQAEAVLSTLLQEQLPAYHEQCGRLENQPPIGILVPRAAVVLGMVRLYLGRTTDGEQRRQWLEQAQKAFLASRPRVEKAVEYRVGLGVTCDLLGQRSDANVLFGQIRASDDPAIQRKAREMLAALGADERARSLDIAPREMP